MTRDNFTKVLHALIAMGITANLALSQFMAAAEPGVPGDGPYLVHQWAGVGLLGVLVVYWLWKLAGHCPQGSTYFFPWFSRRSYLAMWSDAKTLLRLRVRDFPESSALSGAVHGLGLMTAAAMAISGTVQYVILQGYVASPTLFDFAKTSHELLANFMWAYLIGHVVMGLAHQALGHQSIVKMFSAGR